MNGFLTRARTRMASIASTTLAAIKDPRETIVGLLTGLERAVTRLAPVPHDDEDTTTPKDAVTDTTPATPPLPPPCTAPTPDTACTAHPFPHASTRDGAPTSGHMAFHAHALHGSMHMWTTAPH
ncbi:hypothetical protein [Embleya sp. AB8]|uniref:hypothetical protein n=1 Tax=Embleya sp. AB8 TaxID=3156304 RepID=UPI003C70BCF9